MSLNCAKIAPPPVPHWYQQLIDENDRLKAAMRKFCQRVDAGEIRSIRTYTEFKTLLGDK